MTFQPYLTFNGECEAAFKAYESCFDGKITVSMTWGAGPMAKDVPSIMADKIMHATLNVGDVALSGGDVPPDQYQKPHGFEVLINLEGTDAERAERIFKTLADGGEIKVPLQQTFWATRFGTVVDRFGTPWTVNCGTQA